MKFKHGFRVVIPHIDEHGRYQYSNIYTNDSVDHRAVKRILRVWVKNNLQRQLDPHTARLLYKSVTRHNQPMMYIRPA